MKTNEHTSICIFKCCLKLDKRVRKMASESSNTSGTELTPFLDRATHKYCLMAFINISLVLKTGPAFCRMDNRSCRDRTLDRSSCDLKEQWRKKFSKMKFCNDANMYMYLNALWIWIQKVFMIRNHTLDLVVHQPKVSWRVYTGFWTPEKHLFAVCGWTRLVSFPRPLHLQILAKTKQKIISHQLYNIPLIMHVISIHRMYMYYKIWKCPQESGMYNFHAENFKVHAY